MSDVLIRRKGWSVGSCNIGAVVVFFPMIFTKRDMVRMASFDGPPGGPNADLLIVIAMDKAPMNSYRISNNQ